MAFYIGNNKVLDSSGWNMTNIAAENHSTFDSGEFQAQSGNWWTTLKRSNGYYVPDNITKPRTEGWTTGVSTTSIAVGGGIIAVGDGGYDDSSYTNVGRVDLFDNKGNWFRSLNVDSNTYDTPANTIGFGNNVTIGHGRLAVSTYAKSVNPSYGKVYVYDLSGNYIDEFQTDSFSASVGFPTSIALGKRHLVVGDHLWDSSGAGSGDWNGEGKVHIFDITNELPERSVTFGQAHRMGLTSRGENPTVRSGVSFGWTVSTGYGRIYVGAYGDNSDSTGSFSSQGVGSAFMLDFDGNFLSKFDAYSAVYPPGPVSRGASEDKFGTSIRVGQGMLAITAPNFDDTASGGTNEGVVYITDLNGEHLLRQGNIQVSSGYGRVDSSNLGWDTEFSNLQSTGSYNDDAWIDNDRIYYPRAFNNGTNTRFTPLRLDGSGAEATMNTVDSLAIRDDYWTDLMGAGGGLWTNVDIGVEELNIQNSNLTLSGYLDKVLRKT